MAKNGVVITLDEVRPWLNNTGYRYEKTRKVFTEDIGVNAENQLKDYIRPHSVSNITENSVTSKVKGFNVGSLAVEIFAGESLIVNTIIGEGRKPGKAPPVLALKKWVKRKLGVDEFYAEGVAYLVAQKIAYYGNDQYESGTNKIKQWSRKNKKLVDRAREKIADIFIK